MAASEDTTPQQPDVLADGMTVRADGGYVVVEGPAGAMTLTPDAAARSAERLLQAAEAARGSAAGQGKRPPFPPAELVSPHGAS